MKFLNSWFFGMNEDYMDSIGKFEPNSRRDMEDSKTAPLSQGMISIVDMQFWQSWNSELHL